VQNAGATREIIVSPAAQADLVAQWDYFANELRRPDLGDRFILSAELSFTSMARDPDLRPCRAFQNPKLKHLRSWQIKNFPNHLIFYRHLPEQRIVEVVRVLHGARDLLKILNG
jgi:plasmid stabilization system protein ParE